jgi:flagellar basal body L-ring protein FlgH
MFKQGNRQKSMAITNNNNNQTAESSSQALYTDRRAQLSGRIKQVKIKREVTDKESRRFDEVSKQSKQNHCKT